MAVKPSAPAAGVASSLDNVPRSRIREIADLAMTMDGVLRLYFGESNLPTPQLIRDAAADAMNGGYTLYTENAGLPSLREALATYYEHFHGVPLDPASEIVVTTSGVQALNVGIRCVLDPGDEAIVMTPVWPNGGAIVGMANGVEVQVEYSLRDGRYQVDIDALEAAVTPRTRLLIVTSPSNPLGWVATVEEQQALLEFARRHNLWILADEVYERLYYLAETPGDPAPSILQLADRNDPIIVAQSFSKTYCMTGWRVGWLVARADAAERITQLNEFIVSCPAGFTQKACEVALAKGEDELRSMVGSFKENRDLCLEALSTMPGVTVPETDGAFYLFPKVEGLDDSFAFCRDLLTEERVGLAPGVAFGRGGDGSVRICYASDRSVLEPALERLDRFLRR